MLCDAVPVLITACGMTLVIICRQIDISIGSQFALCSVFAGLAASNGLPMPVVAVIAVLCGAAMGAFNGAIVAGLGIPSIVVTLATMVTWREALRWWREGEFVSGLPDSFQWFGLSQQLGQFTIIAIAVLLFLLLALALKAPIGWTLRLCRRVRQGGSPARRHSPAAGNLCRIFAHGRSHWPRSFAQCRALS